MNKSVIGNWVIEGVIEKGTASAMPFRLQRLGTCRPGLSVRNDLEIGYWVLCWAPVDWARATVVSVSGS
jgi:hypothetical protein